MALQPLRRVRDVIQPDVLEFIRTWLTEQAPGSGIEGWAIVTYDDDGYHQPPFYFLEEAGFVRLPEVPFYQPFRLQVTAYGRTKREAGEGYRAITDLLHNAVDVESADGVHLCRAEDETGPQPGPEGRWPARLGIIALYMPDRALPVGS